MCFNAGTHSCAYLKRAAGWLAEGDFANHSGLQQNYALHAIGISPPPPGRVAAVRIASRTSAQAFIIEARLKADVYEKGFAPNITGNEFRGLPGEGVIVYEVTSPAHLEQVKLANVSALAIGQTYTNSDEGFTVKPTAAIEGGITVQVTRAADPRCDNLLQQIADIDELLAEETDPNIKKQLRAERDRLTKQAKSFGCL
jgi:hypothetical protein